MYGDHYYQFSNGAVGQCRPGYPHLSVLAHVRNCPVAGTDLRVTAKAVRRPDTMFSIPATARIGNYRVRGYLTVTDDCVEFNRENDL